MKRTHDLLDMGTVLTLLLLLFGTLQGAEPSGRWGVGLQGGAYKLVLTDHSDAWTPGWLVNADLKYQVKPRLAIGAEGSWMRTYLADLSEGSKLEDGAGLTTDNISDGPRQRAYVAGLFAEYRFLEERVWSPYVVAGPGMYIWKWTDGDGNTLMSDDPALEDSRVGLRVPPFDLAGNPYELKDQEIYAMVGTGVEFFPHERLSCELGAKFRWLTHLFTGFSDDQDVVGAGDDQLDLPNGIVELYAGLTFHFGGTWCPPEVASASGKPTNGPAPLTVRFDGSVTGGCPEHAFEWDFDDGTTSAEQNPSHTFEKPGEYFVALTVLDSKKTPSQSSVSVTVGCPRAVGSASADVAAGVVPLTVKFQGEATGGCPPVTYAWDFGDGTKSIEQSPSHTYRKAGIFEATLTITDSKGGKSEKSVSIVAEEPFIPTQERPVVLQGVGFERNKAVLLAESVQILDQVAASLINHPEVSVEIGGHSDSDGSDAHNLKLSDQRANIVREYLVLKGVLAKQVTAKGYGETKPIADNATAEGRAANRRVELKRM